MALLLRRLRRTCSSPNTPGGVSPVSLSQSEGPAHLRRSGGPLPPGKIPSEPSTLSRPGEAAQRSTRSGHRAHRARREAGSCHCSVALSGSWRAEHESVIQLLCLMGDGLCCPLLRRGWRPRELPAAQGGHQPLPRRPQAAIKTDRAQGGPRASSQGTGARALCGAHGGGWSHPTLQKRTRGPMTTAGSNPHLQGS